VQYGPSIINSSWCSVGAADDGSGGVSLGQISLENI